MTITRLLPFVAAGALIAAPLAAQKDTTHGKTVSTVAKTNATANTHAGSKTAKTNLQAMAKISRDSAQTIALAKVATGSTVKTAELEREKGTVVYSFDITVPGRTGVEEILVSAIDGHVVSQKHETPKMEKAEAKKDAAAKKKKG